MKAFQRRPAPSSPGAIVEASSRATGLCRAARGDELPLFVNRQTAAAESPLLLRKSCGIDCACATCKANGMQLSQRGDALEQEADATAERVMRKAPGPAVPPAGHGVTTPPLSMLVPTGGRGLDAVTRAYMEPRFGARFDSVRIHDSADAAQRASNFAAHAYTVGEHLVFGAGRYRPGSDSGRRLIAHELAHVIQGRQGRIPGAIARTVDPARLSCPANTAGASADPAADLASLDSRAQGLAESMSIFGIISSILNPARDSTSFAIAYRTRMGRPEKVGRKFRDRFSRNLFSSEKEAAQAEVEVISDRFSLITDFLGGPIRYVCGANGVTFTLGDCRVTCRPTVTGKACIPGDKQSIGICPDFWTMKTDNQRASVLIHETAHARLDLKDNSSRSSAQRGSNPYCYDSMVADVFGFPAAGGGCPPIRR